MPSGPRAAPPDGAAFVHDLKRFHARIRRPGSRTRTLVLTRPSESQAFLKPLRQFLVEARGAGTRVREARVYSPLDPPFEFLKAWSSEAGGRQGASFDSHRADDEPHRFERLRRALRSLAEGRTLLLVLHDVHLLDGDGLVLIGRLAARLRQLSARRGAGGSERFGLILTRVAGGAPLVLEGTEEVDLDSGPPDDEIQRVFVGAAGAGVEAPMAQVAALMARPGGLETLVLAGMPGEERRALEALALLGRPSDEKELSGIAGVPGATVRRLIADRALVSEDDAIGLGPLVGRARLLEGLTQERRRPLHARIAEVLEAQPRGGGARAAAQDEERARHLLAAGDIDRAVGSVLAAAAGLRAAGASRRALSLLEALFDVAPERADDPSMIEHAALAAEASDRWEEALSLGQRLLSMQRGTPGESRAALLVGRLLRGQGALDEAVAVLEDGRERAELRAPEVRAHLAAELAETLLQSGAVARAERVARAALAESALLERHEGLLSVGQTLAKVLLHVGRVQEARDLYERVAESARSLGLFEDEARARYNLGVLALDEGALALAERAFTSSLALSREGNDPLGVGLALTNLAVLHADRHRLGAALAAAEEAIAAFEELGEPERLATALAARAALLLSAGDTSSARRAVERAVDLAAESPLLLTHCRLREAEVALAEGRFATAETGFVRVLEDLAGAGGDDEPPEVLMDRAWASLGLAQLAEARGAPGPAFQFLEDLFALFPTGVDGLSPDANVELLALATSLRADLWARQGRTDLASSELARAARSLGVAARPVERAYALVRRAELLTGDEETQALLVEESESLLTEVEEMLPPGLVAGFRARPLVARTRAVAQRVRAGDEARPRPEGAVSVPVQEAPPVAASAWRARFPEIVGDSRSLRRVLQMVDRVAAVDSTVLLLGESGTGKELIARALVRLSSRHGRPFVRINAAALPESLLQSELFGYERGAFTGADRQHKGAFESAHGGSLFLDEIGDISPATQVSLLRVLQEKEVQRIGATRAVAVDVRVICATNRDLDELVAEGRFRLDLYHRIRGLTIRVPPLRERPEDIAPLARHILAGLSKELGRPLRLDAGAEAVIARAPWPGNVRELENVLRSVAVMSERDPLTADEVTRFAGSSVSAAPPGMEGGLDFATAVGVPVELDEGFSLADAKLRLERALIERALAQTGGNITRAAPLLGMKRARLSQRIKELDLK
jgi:DNA-binding NtrC family response regulator/tetratricopeptide (TPR) repeat protein